MNPKQRYMKSSFNLKLTNLKDVGCYDKNHQKVINMSLKRVYLKWDFPLFSYPLFDKNGLNE